jgi:hypothetical protein
MGKTVDRDDVVPLTHELVDEHTADEAGGPRHDDRHRSPHRRLGYP